MSDTVRPQKIADFVGADEVRGDLLLSLRAAQMRKEPMGHVLLYGPPGLGKSSLAWCIAAEQGVRCVTVTGPSIDSIQKLITIVSQVHYGEVLFLDEVHRLPKAVEETLYSVLEDSALFAAMGRTVVQRKLPKFTIVGATTRFALMAPPLRDRFSPNIYRLDFYSGKEMEEVVRRAAAGMEVNIEPEAVAALGMRGRGTPRVVLGLLRKAADYALVLGGGDGTITGELCSEWLKLSGIDALGLGGVERRYMRVLVEECEGGPAGLEVLAARASEDEGTLADVVEPYLMRLGLLDRTPKGRLVTAAGFEWWYKEGKEGKDGKQ